MDNILSDNIRLAFVKMKNSFGRNLVRIFIQFVEENKWLKFI